MSNSNLALNNLIQVGMSSDIEMTYPEIIAHYQKNNCWGLMSSIDVSECDPVLIRSADAIREYVVELCKLIEMKRFQDTTVVNFGEDEKVAGYSMVQLIETSLISGHFANLTNTAYIDIFSCKLYDPTKATEFTRAFFKGEQARLKVHFRY